MQPELGTARTEQNAALAAPEPAPEDAAEHFVVLFEQPLTLGGPEIVGRTIQQVPELCPLLPPIEGLPEAMWKRHLFEL